MRNKSRSTQASGDGINEGVIIAILTMMKRDRLSIVLCSLILALTSARAQVQTGVVSDPPPVAPTPAPLPSPAPLTPAAPDTNANIDFDNIAKIPYEALIKIAQSDAAQPKDADIYTLRISSKIETVKPGQIELFLDRTKAPHVLKVDANGYFMVPHNAELLAENPDLVSNQPKGSLNLEVKLSLPKPELPKITDGRVRYQELFKPIIVLNDAMRQVDPNFGQPEQQQFAIEIATGTEGWVKMQREFGARTLAPDKAGSVWITYEKLLFDENPEIQIMPLDSELSVRPITAAQASDIRSR